MQLIIRIIIDTMIIEIFHLL